MKCNRKKLSCEILNKITKSLNNSIQKQTILGWHDLQTRRSGTAHEKSDIIEENIKNIFPNAMILTHFDLHSEYLTSHTCNK